MKIILAVDGSEYGDAAVHEVARRPWPAHTEVKIMTAVELPYVPTTEGWVLPEEYYAGLEKTARTEAQAAIEKAIEHIKRHQGTSLTITSDIREGRAEDVILDEADHWGADLILVGSHGYRGFKRFLLGSVSQAVASHAKCSVEIVRIKQ